MLEVERRLSKYSPEPENGFEYISKIEMDEHKDTASSTTQSIVAS